MQRKKPRAFLPDEWVILPADGIGVAIAGTGAVVISLDPDETYVFEVRGTNVHGDGEWSDSSAEIAVEDQRPAQPQNLSGVMLIGNRGFDLKWDPVAGATRYEVEISPMEASQQINISGESVEITGLAPSPAYTFSVKGVNNFGEGPAATRSYSLAEPKHWWGHQADHTVKYVVGTIGNSIIRHAIATAAVDWNSRMQTLNKGLEICAGGGCDDSFTVTIKAVDNKNDATGSPSNNPNEGCGSSYACVKPVGAGGANSSGGPGRHMENMYMVFEDPPKSARRVPPRTGPWVHTVWEWTDQTSLQGRRVPCPPHAPCASMPPSFYLYVEPVMLHEFGHTFGLHDFYNDSMMDQLDAVMNTSNGIRPDIATSRRYDIHAQSGSLRRIRSALFRVRQPA